MLHGVVQDGLHVVQRGTAFGRQTASLGAQKAQLQAGGAEGRTQVVVQLPAEPLLLSATQIHLGGR